MNVVIQGVSWISLKSVFEDSTKQSSEASYSRGCSRSPRLLRSPVGSSVRLKWTCRRGRCLLSQGSLHVPRSAGQSCPFGFTAHDQKVHFSMIVSLYFVSRYRSLCISALEARVGHGSFSPMVHKFKFHDTNGRTEIIEPEMKRIRLFYSNSNSFKGEKWVKQ